MSGVAVACLDAGAVADVQAELARFERTFSYPLGDDTFRIDHGDDYLAFFRGLGEPAAFVARRDGRIAGVLVAVLRLVPAPAFYVCDLKVAAGASGCAVGATLLRAFATRCLAPSTPVFGVSMNAANGSNRLRRVALRCREAAVCAGPTLAVFSLDFATYGRIEPTLRRALGPISCYDPRGRKDIVLASTGSPMPLLHIQHGRFARADITDPRPSCTHMICLPTSDPLVAELARAEVQPGASASVLQRGLSTFAWRDVLTSDI